MAALPCTRCQRHPRRPQRPLAIGTDKRAVSRGHRCGWGGGLGLRGQCGGRRGVARHRRFVFRHLTHQHVSQANAATLTRQGHGQLLVVHFLILLGRRGVERIVLTQHFVGRAHRLEHFIQEQRLEFLRNLAHVAVAFAVAHFQVVQTVQVGERTRITAADDTTLTHIHDAGLRSQSGRLAARRPV